METVDQVMGVLERKGTTATRNTYLRHGAPEETYGVKVGDLKPIARGIQGNQQLAMELYESGNSDAMYLAGMVADGARMTKKQLEEWVKGASWYYISEYAVPGVAVENKSARDLAIKWMKSKTESIAACGWATYSGVLATREDADLDKTEIKSLLKKIEAEIGQAPNRVRYTMNGFVISVGTYVKSLLKQAKKTADAIGVIECDMGDTACKVPLATEYIEKVEARGTVGQKRSSLKS
ncbi:MAG: DNA alkylation repair protein [Planctomycetota bacterium]|nr:DNA alkylation repair protein [Planctomycetota bacterium]